MQQLLASLLHILLFSYWATEDLFCLSVLTRPQACEYLSRRHTSAPPLSVQLSGRDCLPHLSPVRGVLKGRRNMSSDLCFCIHGSSPPPLCPIPLWSSSVPHVSSAEVWESLVGGYWDPSEYRGDTSSDQLCSLPGDTCLPWRAGKGLDLKPPDIWVSSFPGTQLKTSY